LLLVEGLVVFVLTTRVVFEELGFGEL
jgi:hypothetical protein